MIKRLIPSSVKQYLKDMSGVSRLVHEGAVRARLLDELLGKVLELQAQLAASRSLAHEQSVALEALNTRLGTAEQGLAAVQATFPGVWRQDILGEPVVALALRDLCRPGEVVFDCGANEGLLSILVSRLVGPRGTVCAFEASPRVVDSCLRNLVQNGCHNVTLYQSAIYCRSDEWVPIYFGDHTQADSIIWGADRPGAGPAHVVPTLALDDYVRRTGLVPNLIKMDIEGAEYDALRGAEATVESARPHLILETYVEDERCLRLLRSLGYRALDLNTYREVCSRDDYPAGVELRNLLYVHDDRLASTGYVLPFAWEEVTRITAADCRSLPDGSVQQKQSVRLPPGRYLIDVRAVAERSDNEMICGVRADETPAMMYQCNTQHIFRSYRDWVIDLPVPRSVRLFFDFLRGSTDPTFRFTEAIIRRLPLFDKRAAGALRKQAA